MLIKEYFSNINKKYLNHKFSGISFNSSQIKKGFIFLQLKEMRLMEKNLLIKQSKMVPKQSFQILNIKVIKKTHYF